MELQIYKLITIVWRFEPILNVVNLCLKALLLLVFLEMGQVSRLCVLKIKLVEIPAFLWFSTRLRVLVRKLLPVVLSSHRVRFELVDSLVFIWNFVVDLRKTRTYGPLHAAVQILLVYCVQFHR